MNQDFYPTPKKLIAKMVAGISFNEVREVLEPSAGKGDICDYVSQHLRYREGENKIDVIEIEEDLRATLRGKGYNVVYDDFLAFQTRKVYDLIIANFPFSDGDRHLSHALDLLEANGGNLVCLVNAETIRNPYTNLRQAVVKRLEKYSAAIEYLPGEFTDAERKTDVEVALVRVSVQKEHPVSLILDSLKKAKAVDASETVETKIIDKDFLKSLVSRFNLECDIGIKLIEEWFNLKPYMTDRLKMGDDEDRYASDIIKLEVEGAYGSKASYINSYLREVRYKFWQLLVNDPRFNASYTSNILSELNQKLNQLRDCDFNLFNIQQLERELGQKIGQGIEASILKLFDELSGKYAWHQDVQNGNVHYYNGWKTNKAHKINARVVVPMYAFSSYDKDRVDYRFHERLTDIVKVFNFLAGNLENVPKLVGETIRMADASHDFSGLDMRYFEITLYKKGTAHIRFKDQQLLDKFNIFGSQRKGWLPPSYGRKIYREMDASEKAVIDDFQGEAKYAEVMDKKDYYLVTGTDQLLLR